MLFPYFFHNGFRMRQTTFTSLWKHYRQPLFFALFVLFSIGLGFIVTSGEIIATDDVNRIVHGQWLLSRIGLTEPTANIAKWYGPLWDIITYSAHVSIFSFLNNPYWVMHALTFALFPITLALTYILLGRAGVPSSTRILILALLFGMIRFGGHASVNVKDFPAACAYLIVTLYLWIALKDKRTTKGYDFLTLMELGIIAAIPFMIRTPNGFHLIFLTAFVFIHNYFFLPRTNLRQRIFPPVMLLVAGLCAIFILYPTWWELSFNSLKKPFTLFSSYNWGGEIRIFGNSIFIEARETPIPWWYVFTWPPIITHPLAFFVMIIGIIGSLTKEIQNKYPFKLSSKSKEFNLSLVRWIWLITILSFAAILIIRPLLYDEERQILFLYPLLMIIAGLGLDDLRKNWKLLIAGLITILSLFSYINWQRYSYTYKSPLIGDTSSQQFLGDYYMTCFAPAVRKIHESIPAGTLIVVNGPKHIVEYQISDLRNINYPSPIPDIAEYPVSWDKPTDGSAYAVLTSNRLGWHEPVVDAIVRGEAQLIWQDFMPPGEPACILAYFPEIQKTDKREFIKNVYGE